MPPTYRVGTSGWSYKHWRGDFYPSELPASQWLEHYARHFDTVEVNNSFYRMPNTKTTESWGKRVPEGFTFTFKVSRFITHIKRLQDAAEPLSNFTQRVEPVGPEHLGAYLYQTPPGMRLDLDRLESFLAVLAPERDHVIEFRHGSWFADEAIALLQRYGAGFCVHDMRGVRSPVTATGRVAYFRFHGPTQEAYAGSYSDALLAEWADRIRSIGKDVETVYVYFNNDIGGHAIRNALTLREMLAQ